MGVIGHFITRKFLHRQSQIHVSQYPQLACFAFDQITHSIHLEGRYENDILGFLAASIFPNLPSGGTCLDIGANIGNHSLAFSGHFDRVISFEPHPRTFRLLEVNGDLVDNVTPINLGLSSTAGTFEIVEDKLNIGASSLERTLDPKGAAISFKVDRLDDLDLMKTMGPITFMKLDIEGHEAEALRGAQDTIATHGPVVMIEVLPHEIEQGDAEALNVLRGFVFTYFYEGVEKGRLGTLPRRRKKWARAFRSLISGKRPSKTEVLNPISQLEARSYPMILCTKTALNAA
ncbi:FkbM family methyltransferase [Pseudooctadecabacter sp.]|uniref:FkbM family methyltransferase n=1 Tax=Pseudooctadecabacter sp. TaxID=1966338 RepID=UPI003F6BABE0